MAMFAKKQEGDHKTGAEGGGAPATTGTPAGRGGYGIAEAIQLLRGLPVDQNPDLVVRVVRATLASLSVHLSDIIEDANKKQKATQERIASQHTKVAELEKQLGEHRKEIAALEADLKETTTVKERLQMAEKVGGDSDAAARRLARSAHGDAVGQQVARRVGQQGLAAPQTRLRLRDVAVVLVRAEKVVNQREQLLRRHRPEQQRDAAQILDSAAQRHERNEIRARIAPQDADQLPAAEPFQIQIEDDETGHRLHQHLSGFQAGRDSGHREARLLQHATKLTPAPGIGVRQQNHYMTT
jgi:hypothetical protein